MTQSHTSTNSVSTDTSIQNKLARTIGKAGIAAIAINGLIGAGIFSLPGVAANDSGFFSPWMFLLCGLVMLPIVLCFALLSRYFEGTGGPVNYASVAFGSFIGFQTGWLLYLGRVTAIAANTHALVLYCSLYLPELGQGWLNHLAVTAVIASLMGLNIIGIKNAMQSVLLVTLGKLLPLVLFVLLGISYLQADQLFHAIPPQIEQIPASLLLLVYAYVGFEGALIPAGEAKKPKQDMPSSIISTLFITAILYFFIQSIVVSTLPLPIEGAGAVAQSAQVVFSGYGWTFGMLLMSIAAIISIFGNLLVNMLAAPRMTYALGEQGSLPSWFKKLHPHYATPSNAILFHGGLALVLALSGTFVWLAIFSSVARLVGFAICICALPKIYRNAETTARLGNKMVYMLSLLALVVCVWLASYASVQAWYWLLGFVLLGSLLWHLSRKSDA